MKKGCEPIKFTQSIALSADHSFRPKALTATIKSGDHLSILVEHLGRFNGAQEMLSDNTGLRQITIGGAGVKEWRQSRIPLESFKVM
jgi:hypothetical protein